MSVLYDLLAVADAEQRRLLRIAESHEPIADGHILAVLVNVVCENALTYDYEFRFNRHAHGALLREWRQKKPWRKQ